MTSLRELQRNWEGLAQTDPLWSICTDPEKRDKRWNHEEFFATGKREVEIVLGHLGGLGTPLDQAAPALDFGCGVGRLTRALAGHFPECWGVDISPTMVRMAQDFHRHYERCKFCVNQSCDLPMFRDGYFGFIYSSIVFQHIERKYVDSYLHELIRLLKPGGVFVFHIPDHFKASTIKKLRHKLGLRRRLARLLKTDGDEFRMDMHCISEAAIRKLLSVHQVQIADVQRTNTADPGFNGNLQYLDHDPDRGFVSKQYCVVKDI